MTTAGSSQKWLVFEEFHPVKTFAAPVSASFVSADGKVTDTMENGALNALWHIGAVAYAMMKVENEEEFVGGFEAVRNVVEAARHFLERDGLIFRDHFGNIVERDVAVLNVETDYEVVSAFLTAANPESGKRLKGEFPESVFEGLAATYLYICLREIDAALLWVKVDECELAVRHAIHATNALAGAQAMDSESEVGRDARARLAKSAVLSRYKDDPKQQEKRFVRDCYQKWRDNGGPYRSKAEFARDMLQKCSHLTSQKKIEDWVRQWDKAKRID